MHVIAYAVQIKVIAIQPPKIDSEATGIVKVKR